MSGGPAVEVGRVDLPSEDEANQCGSVGRDRRGPVVAASDLRTKGASTALVFK